GPLGKGPRHSTSRPKTRKAPTVHATIVDLQEQLDRRTRERDEAAEQLAATSAVLKAISSSPGELAPIFSAMLENAMSICEGKFGPIFRYDGELLHWVTGVGTPAAFHEFQRQRGPFRAPAGTPLDRVLQTREVVYTADVAAEENLSAPARLGGARSLVSVPMLK